MLPKEEHIVAEQALATLDADYHALALMPKNVNEAKELAQLMSKSELMPQHLSGKPGDCLLIVMQAHRWRMDPYVVGMCTSVIHKKLCYEGKLVAAALTSMNAIEGRLEYEITGEGASLGITITGTPRGGKPQVLRGTVTGWSTGNEQWKKDPVSMLVYRGTRQWARLFAPEALLGVYTPDEIVEGTAGDIVVTQPSTEVPQTKKAPAPIVDAEVVEPKKTPPSTPAATQAVEQGTVAEPSQTSQPTPTSAPAQAVVGDDSLPFSEPKYQPEIQPGPTPATTKVAIVGDPISETQSRIMKQRQGLVSISDADLAAQFPKIGKLNINDVLAWLESKRK